MKIRRATLEDLNDITEIYNDAVLRTDATFDNEPKTQEQQLSWFRGHDSRHPILVAEVEGRVAGWASLSEWSIRCAYADTAELSVYIEEGSRGRGIGTQLMMAVMDAGRECGLHTVLSRITEGNSISIRLHEAAGFDNVGTMREVGLKFGKLLDVRIMQFMYRRESGTV